MKLNRKMTFGALATVAVVALPIVAVVSCGDKDKDDDRKFDVEFTSKSTFKDFESAMNNLAKASMKQEQSVSKDIIFKIGDQYLTMKKDTSEKELMDVVVDKILPAIKKINPDLAKKIADETSEKK